MFDLKTPIEELKESITDNLIDYEKFIVNPKSINDIVKKFHNGELKKGFKIGIPCFDQHFVCKENELYALTGAKGGGKTTINQAIQIMQSIVNDLVWVCAFQENSDWSQKVNYLNYFFGVKSREIEQNKPEFYKLASDWIDKHFIFLDVETIKEALETTEYLVKKGVNVHALVLDPVNSFKSGFNDTGSGYNDGVETSRQVLRWVKKNCTVYISQHPNMFSQRNKDKKTTSSDAEGGWWLNKADFTWVVHREKDTNLNSIIVEDVRNKHTGGNRTSEDNQLIINWQTTTIDIIRGDEIHKNVIQHLVRKHKPIDYEFEYLEEAKEILPKITVKDAFDIEDCPF